MTKNKYHLFSPLYFSAVRRIIKFGNKNKFIFAFRSHPSRPSRFNNSLMKKGVIHNFPGDVIRNNSMTPKKCQHFLNG